MCSHSTYDSVYFNFPCCCFVSSNTIFKIKYFHLGCSLKMFYFALSLDMRPLTSCYGKANDTFRLRPVFISRSIMNG